MLPASHWLVLLSMESAAGARADILVGVSLSGAEGTMFAISTRDASIELLYDVASALGIAALDMSPGGEFWGQDGFTNLQYDPATGALLGGFDIGGQKLNMGGLTFSPQDEAYALLSFVSTVNIAKWDLQDPDYSIVSEGEPGSFLTALHFKGAELLAIDATSNAIWRVSLPDGVLSMVAKLDRDVGRVQGISELDDLTYIIGDGGDLNPSALFTLDMSSGETGFVGLLPRETHFYSLATIPGCEADINRDGELNVLDFVAFQLTWQGEEAIADCDGDGAWTVLDFVCFQQLFVKGCV